MIPRKFPCKNLEYDFFNTTDHFWKNPLITATFENLTSWKNKRNGAIAGRIGDVRLLNFKVADNLLAGIEVEHTDRTADGIAQVQDPLVIAKTGNTELRLELAEPRGIITPRSENFTLDGAKFYGYNWGRSAALGTCSHCFHPNAIDSGSRTVTVRNLYFDATTTRRIWYQMPFRAIIFDQTGELTGKGPGSWAMGYNKHNDWPGECEHLEDVYDGHTCENTVQVRRVAFHGFTKLLVLNGQSLFVLQYDDDLLAALPDKEAYIEDRSNYQETIFQSKQNPQDAWTMPVVTGHKYKVHWGNTGVDFESMHIQRSERWQHDDKSIMLVHNYSDVRAFITTTINNISYPNDTIPTQDISFSDFRAGQNVLLNETKEFKIIINGKNNTPENHEIYLSGERCEGDCMEVIEEVEQEDRIRYWSVDSDWPDNQVPGKGANIHVESGWNMVYDLEESPVYALIRINGIMTFKNDGETDLHLRCKHLFVRAGQLHIGSEEEPF